ncbi:hypothetical protein SRHO_G00122150 [Serrasalmus rhombeus]
MSQQKLRDKVLSKTEASPLHREQIDKSIGSSTPLTSTTTLARNLLPLLIQGCHLTGGDPENGYWYPVKDMTGVACKVHGTSGQSLLHADRRKKDNMKSTLLQPSCMK